MELRSELKYSKSHEWIKDLGDGKLEIGITDYAQEALGDIVFVNLPEEGDSVEKEVSFCDVESVKAVSDVYSPVTGEVYEVNQEVMDNPASINEGAYEAWLIRVENVTDTEELLTADQYREFVEKEA